MTDSDSDGFDPTAPDQREIGREMVEDSTGLGSVMPHAYRGEIGSALTGRCAPRSYYSRPHCVRYRYAPAGILASETSEKSVGKRPQ